MPNDLTDAPMVPLPENMKMQAVNAAECYQIRAIAGINGAVVELNFTGADSQAAQAQSSALQIPCAVPPPPTFRAEFHTNMGRWIQAHTRTSET